MKSFDFNKYIKNNPLLKEEAEAVSPETAAAKVAKITTSLEKSPEINKIADDIAKDPKALQQLQDLFKKAGVNPNELSENVDPSAVQKLALFTAKKAEDETIEEGGYDIGSSFWVGLVGGGALANYIASAGDVLTKYQQMMGYSPSHISETIIGAIAGAALAVIAKIIYDKRKG